MNKKILIIDNTVSHVTSYPLLLKEGYEVEMARNSDSDLSQLNLQAYDAIIVQENPEAESWQLCERIRHLCGRPLIVISKNASTETCVRTINAGADYFIRKPFGPLELLARIQSLVQRAPLKQPEPIVS